MNNELRKLIIKDIQKVLTLLIDEKYWTKRALCRDKDDEQLFYPLDDRCRKWCIYGALYALECADETFDYLRKMGKSLGYSDLDRLNDYNDHHFIIQFLQQSLNNLGGWFILIKPLQYLKKKQEIEKENIQ